MPSAIVTGGNSGIGRACCVALARRADFENVPGADAVVDELAEALGGVDAFVANAAAGHSTPFLETDVGVPRQPDVEPAQRRPVRRGAPGHPRVIALRHDQPTALGETVRPGDLVLAGSLCHVAVSPGAHLAADVDGLGRACGHT